MNVLSWEGFLRRAADCTGAEHLDPAAPISLNRDAWTAWWEGELDRPLVMIEGYEPPDGEPKPTAGSRPVKVPTLPDHWTISQTLDYYEAWLAARRYYGDAFPKWFPDLGSNGVAVFRGTSVRTTESGEIWFVSDNITDSSQIQLTYDPENWWWKQVQELTRAAIQRWQGRVVIGHVVMGGNLDILAAIRSIQGLAGDMIDCPDVVSRVANELTRLWLRYYDELADIIAANGLGTTNWAAIWSPSRCYMLQSDFAALISPRMFRRFVLPDIEECCSNLDHPFYHLDGKGQIAHLDMLLGIQNLKGIQWIPGAGQPPPEEWLPLLKRIRDAGKLCQLYVSPDGARKVVRELGGKGFAFFVEGNMGREAALDLLQELAATDMR